MRKLIGCLVLALSACGAAPEAPPATPVNPASTVSEAVDRINAEQASLAPNEGAVDPLMEDQCKTVSRDEAAQLEARLQRERAAGELTVLTGNDTTVLGCSRYWAKLERR